SPASTLFPYTTLFRSSRRGAVEVWASRYLVAVLADAETVRRLSPDIAALKGMRGEAREAGEVIVCAAAGPEDGVDVIDRFFAPRSEEHTSELQSRENL